MRIAIFIINIFICGSHSRAATIFANSRSLRRLFEGVYYSKYSVYLRKYSSLLLRYFPFISTLLHVYTFYTLYPPLPLSSLALLTLGVHARSEGYCSCPVCVCMSVRSFLPPHASRPRNIGTYVFTATRKNLL